VARDSGVADFPGDQQITNLWNATSTQSGKAVTVTAASYDATIAPGSSVTIGFLGAYTSNNTSPSAFSVNGTACATG
jgi:Cellulose binding domain